MGAKLRNRVATRFACGLLLFGAGLLVTPQARSEEVRRVSTILGANVTLDQGSSVGKVVDLVLNDNGCVDFVVISYEDHYVALPWAVATVNYDEHVIRIDVTRERLREIPTF